MRKNKALIASIVTILAALAVSQGIEVSTEEQAQVVDLVTGITVALASLVGLVKGKVAVVERAQRKAAEADFARRQAIVDAEVTALMTHFLDVEEEDAQDVLDARKALAEPGPSIPFEDIRSLDDGEVVGGLKEEEE
jgi:hypothetical protein